MRQTQEAVRAHVFHQTALEIKARNAGTAPDELQTLIDTAVEEVRAERRAKRKAGRA